MVGKQERWAHQKNYVQMRTYVEKENESETLSAVH